MLQRTPEHQDAQCRHETGAFADAEAGYRQVLLHDANNPHALYGLGTLLLQSGRPSDAVPLLRRALEAVPGSPVVFNALAVALENSRDLDAAEAASREAVGLNPGYGEAWHNLGNVLRQLARPDAAAAAHAEAARLLPDLPAVHGAHGLALLDVGELDAALAAFQRRALMEPAPAAAEGATLFWLLHHPGNSDRQIFEAHRKWAKRHACGPGFQPALSGEADWKPAPLGPLRVGYVSPDFREHTVARFFEPLLSNHDPAAVTSVCYSDAARPDGVTGRLKALAGEWRDTAGMGDAALAERVRADRIDILVDLTGHMGGGRLLVFARKPAPVQVTYLGYPHSTGLDAIGYRITDGASDPVGMTERYHVETLVRLEGCAWCYRPDEDAPEIDEPPAVRNGYVTFGAFNRTAKLTRPVAELWAKVIHAVPDSQLMVLAAGGENNRSVRRLMESAGVPGGRLTLVPSGDRRSYLALCRQADVGLDPFPYNGMTTTCDLLWLGVPTVTLAGTSHRSRVGASLMGAVGLDRCVAVDEAGYVAAAAGLAGDVAALREIRLGLRDRMAASPLRDGAGLARRIEAAYGAMWRAHVTASAN